MSSMKLFGSISLCAFVALFFFGAPSLAGEKSNKTANSSVKIGTGVSINFDDVKAGGGDSRFLITETAGTGKTATWKVLKDEKAPSKPNAFGIVKNSNYGHTFNLAIATKSKLKDLDVSVKLKAVGGKEDEGGGPIWRARDKDNYYIARWNPLEDNFRLYYVKDGRRRQLRSAKVHLDTKVYHTIRVTMVGQKIDCYLDGKKLLSATDKTFADPGMVGLWVKADGRTLFDDFVASPAK